MFGRKKEPKVKEPSPREILMNQIADEVQKLAPGQSLIYKLPELYWSGFAAFLIAELNPSYPKKGRKYIMYTDKIVDGKPAGRRGSGWQTNNPRDYADWVVSRDGERFR